MMRGIVIQELDSIVLFATVFHDSILIHAVSGRSLRVDAVSLLTEMTIA
jgi:hypothetical protein